MQYKIKRDFMKLSYCRAGEIVEFTAEEEKRYRNVIEPVPAEAPKSPAPEPVNSTDSKPNRQLKRKRGIAK